MFRIYLYLNRFDFLKLILLCSYFPCATHLRHRWTCSSSHHLNSFAGSTSHPLSEWQLLSDDLKNLKLPCH